MSLFAKFFEDDVASKHSPAAVNKQIVSQYSQDLPQTKISVRGPGPGKDTEFTTVVIVYDHDAKGGSLDNDPFPFNRDVEPERPEMLQCVVEDGLLRKIHWKAVDKPNRRGFLRYVKTKSRRP
jgi:hypothetical protein